MGLETAIAACTDDRVHFRSHAMKDDRGLHRVV